MGCRAVLLTVLCVLLGCDRDGPAPPIAVAGTVDLRDWKVDESEVLSLQGDWQIFWNRLVEPGASATPDGALPVGRWNGLHLDDGRELHGHGYATYRLLLRLPDAPRAYAVQLTAMTDAAWLLVSRPDGAPLAEPIYSGTVGTSPETSQGSELNGETSFTAGGDVLVTLQISNYQHARGGSGPAPLFGTVHAISARERHRRVVDFFIIGLLFVVGLQHLVQFAMNRVDRSSLWFGLSCLVIAGRMFVIGHYPADAMPSFSTGTSLRLEYLTIYFGVPLIALFIRALFPKYVHARPIQVLGYVSLLFAASVALPPPIFTQLITAYQLLMVVSIAYAVFCLTRALIGDRDLPPGLMLAGFLVLGMCVAWDILSLHRAVQPLNTATQYGLSAFVLSQSTLLALLNRRRSRELEQRNKDVQLLNEQLRQQIAERSHELSHALTLMASPKPSATILRADQVLADKYKIERLIGEGGMGKVYRAERLVDHRPVAIKLVRGGDPRLLARFAGEAELVARIDHRNVVGILDFGITSEAALFLVMELVEGNSLEHARDRFGDLAWAVPMVGQLAAAVETIHALGVIHRDIKPANVLVAGDTIKLTDFGVAHVERMVDPDRSATETVESSEEDPLETASIQPHLTRVGMLIGSPLYMAPELSEGADHASPRSDVFSFGMVAYEMLSKTRPYNEPVVRARMAGKPLPPPPARLGSLVPELPARLAELIDQCLDLSADARPDAGTVARAFGESG